MKKTQVYDGNGLFFNDFGLYPAEDIDLKTSKEMIEHHFRKEFEEKIKTTLAKYDMKIVNWNYFSPTYYNYHTDSLDLEIEFLDQNMTKYKKFIKEEEGGINEKLDENESMDGYFATTIESVDKEIESMQEENYSPDIIIMNFLLDFDTDFSKFEPREYVVYDEEEDEE